MNKLIMDSLKLATRSVNYPYLSMIKLDQLFTPIIYYTFLILNYPLITPPLFPPSIHLGTGLTHPIYRRQPR